MSYTFETKVPGIKDAILLKAKQLGHTDEEVAELNENLKKYIKNGEILTIEVCSMTHELSVVKDE